MHCVLGTLCKVSLSFTLESATMITLAEDPENLGTILAQSILVGSPDAHIAEASIELSEGTEVLAFEGQLFVTEPNTALALVGE